MKLSSKLASVGSSCVGMGTGAMIFVVVSPLLSAPSQVAAHLRDAAILLAMIGAILIGIGVAQATGERNAEREEDRRR